MSKCPEKCRRSEEEEEKVTAARRGWRNGKWHQEEGRRSKLQIEKKERGEKQNEKKERMVVLTGMIQQVTEHVW